MRKTELDLRTALETGEALETVTPITRAFLEEIIQALSDGKEVSLWSFGKFKLVKQAGAPPPHARFGGATAGNSGGSPVRFRIHFSKATRLKSEIWRKYKEKLLGQARRRRID